MITIKDNRFDYCAACVTICPPDCIEVRESSIEIADEETNLTEAQLKKLLNPSKLTKGGISK